MISGTFYKVRDFFNDEHPWIVWGLIFGIFVVAAVLRLAMPNLTVSDPDTWGYLNPALRELAGMGFQQTHGRGIAYPLFLLWLLQVTGDFASITAAQHVIGILSGIVWWGVWTQWRAWLPKKIQRAFWLECIGLVFLALFLWNAPTLLYECWVRPEGIFPILALGQTYFCMRYAQARWGNSNFLDAFVSGAAALLMAFICISAKPSWGLAALVPFFIIFVGLCGDSMIKKLPSRLAPLLLGLVLVLGWIKILPPSVGWIPDERSKSFLPATLFTIHAPTIAKVLAQRVEKGTTPEETEFLDKWITRIEESSRLEKTSYDILNHDPDYLMYHSDAIANLPNSSNPSEARTYMFTAYFESLYYFPLDIFIKFAKQVKASFSDLTKTLYRRDLGLQSRLEGSVRSMDFYELPDLNEDLIASYTKARLDTANYLNESALRLNFGPSVNKFFLLGAGPALLGFWMIMWPVFAGVSFLRKETTQPTKHALLAFGILWATCLGTTFTVAIVHSFDIDRYLHLLAAQHSLLLATSLSMTLCFLSRYWSQFGRRNKH